MAEATVQITNNNSPLGRSMQADMNARGNFQELDPTVYRKPEYHVYLYTISKKSFNVSLPPQLQKLNIRACEPNERYAIVATFPNPYNQIDRDENGNMITRYIDARRLCQDICNPNNFTLNQDAGSNADSFSEGNDKSKKGVFWSLNNPPTEEEIKAAETRRDNYFRSLLEKARIVESSGNKAALEALITSDYIMAANHFKKAVSWNETLQVPQELTECPNCGESVKPGRAYHSLDGVICVIDWQKAVAAGVKKYEDVPDELRWRTPAENAKIALDKLPK
jgi:hypothetical protein